MCESVSCSIKSDSVTPWTVVHQAPPLSMGFSRQEHWNGYPGDLPDPGIKPRSPALQADSFHLSHQESPIIHQFWKRTSVWTFSGQSLQCAAEESNLAVHTTSCCSSDFQEPVSWLVPIQLSVPKCHNSNIHTIHPKLAVYESTTTSRNKRPGVCVRFIPRCLAKAVQTRRGRRERQELEARKDI